MLLEDRIGAQFVVSGLTMAVIRIAQFSYGNSLTSLATLIKDDRLTKSEGQNISKILSIIYYTLSTLTLTLQYPKIICYCECQSK